ncbi:uncharacterized protein K452DRAFT_65976 [Aplosporella prunicola CBS 121167]|uniref:Autophagy-related protein 1 n=1 Tax=Aplosporella prunicola CBS 121167 TaxID=1176127 RepID=A0A6A6BUI9_9PEZI|nr:uncharacterized protein K452DRAFT_65976 [Aplosporella prunicola CBS 121167]KAF2146467.1 hypothetical protein K452DRAFT_65976 [Aplosporella prunicola CBS 121167]
MEEELTQPMTQQVLDPRRLGRNDSGLDEADITDVICILHPTSPAAFRIVAHTARHAPQHVLQRSRGPSPEGNPEETETFILNESGEAQELALRYSSVVKRPHYQFCFGRNAAMSDITMQVGEDSSRRVSNVHFRIFVNDAGIIMLEDMSTNGTMVDEKLLKAKTRERNAEKTRMLQQSTIIHILSPNPQEVIKFIVRIPSREGFEVEHDTRLTEYLERMEEIDRRFREEVRRQNTQPEMALPVIPGQHPAPNSRRAAFRAHYTHGMHWNGKPDYNVVDQLGKGAFATVYKLATAMDGRLLAAKELEKKRFIKNGKMDQKLDNEMKIMKDLSHPHIVQYIDYRDQGNYLYIIMEYVPFGDLSKLLDHGNLDEYSARRMACQILSSLAYLHSKQITHRDIKPDNILIASEQPLNVKLSDFGLSKVVSNNETFLKTFCGTLLYCAPEVFPHYDNYERGTKRRRHESGKKYHSYSQSVDIWSFGAVLWYSLCGKPPFEGVMDNTGKGMFHKIMDTLLDPTPLTLAGVSDAGIDLLMAMLNRDPASRPTEHDCLRHPWLSSLAEELIPGLVPQKSLHAIPEEAEEDEQAETEDKLSQLSLNDIKAGYGPPEESDDEEDEDEDEEADVEPDDSWEVPTAHQSKRIKRDDRFPRNQFREPPESDSSPDPSQQLPTRFRNVNDTFRVPRSAPGRHLFGEVGQSALENPGVLGERINRAILVLDESMSSSGPETPKKVNQANRSAKRISSDSQCTPKLDHRGNMAAESLCGAESMVRDLTMHSPSSPNSPEEISNEPRTPEFLGSQHCPLPDTSAGQEPVVEQDEFAEDTHDHPEEATPKAPETRFNRQITLPFTTFSFWGSYRPNDIETEAYDPTTEATSEANGFATRVSMPDTTHGGYEDDDNEDSKGGEDIPIKDEEDGEEKKLIKYEKNSEENAASFTTANETKDCVSGALVTAPSNVPICPPPRPRLGKLTSVEGSILPLVLHLEERTTSWGRNLENTIVYKHPADTRVPKMAFTLWYHSKVPDSEKGWTKLKDWTKLDDLKVFINTGASNGIWVNDTKLAKNSSNGKVLFGTLYTGDIITVFRGKEFLKFVCEFFHGNPAKTRPPDEPFWFAEEIK